MTVEVAEGKVHSMDYIFRACACYVWPVTPYNGIARCGGCGQYPDLAVEAPRSGKATPLADYIAQSQRRK